jgi:hypothetical protein
VFEPRCEPTELETALLEHAATAAEREGGTRGELPLTPEAVEALRSAAVRVEDGAESELSVEHLVLGVIDTGGAVSSKALRRVGIQTPDDWIQPSK